MAHETKTGPNISTFFSEKDILVNPPAASKNEIIKRLLAILDKNYGVGDLKAAFDAIMEREASFLTMLAPDFALPHARLDNIDKPLISITTSSSGIIYSEAGEKVKLIVLILAPKNKPGVYLELLSVLGRIFSEPNVIQWLVGKETPKEIWTFFHRGGHILPDYVCARDIMIPGPIALKENDTLEKAIDLFVKKNLTDVPVVDKDGELIGVVTADALLKICLPDYLLWMDDLSPIINFEPFGNVLQNESKTWLADIMSYDCAVVTDDSPAMNVAKEITKNKTKLAYVTCKKKLIGVITLQHFLNKVLRE